MYQYNTYEVPHVIPQNIVEQGLYRLCVVEWSNGDMKILAFDDRDEPVKPLKNYNKTWRAWTNKPDDALRYLTSWDPIEKEE